MSVDGKMLNQILVPTPFYFKCFVIAEENRKSIACHTRDELPTGSFKHSGQLVHLKKTRGNYRKYYKAFPLWRVKKVSSPI